MLIMGMAAGVMYNAMKLFSNVYDVCVCACAHVCVVHLYCSAQLSIFNNNMEKRYRNKIIIIVIIIIMYSLLVRNKVHGSHCPNHTS